VLLIVIAVVCLGLGAAGAFAFAPPSYDRGSNGITAGSTLEDGGVVPVLAALRSPASRRPAGTTATPTSRQPASR